MMKKTGIMLAVAAWLGCATAEAQSLVSENVFKDITTKAKVRNQRFARPAPAGKYRKEGKPVAFYIGDSTMRTLTDGSGWSGEWGFGLFAQEWFDENELVVENHALGGTSSRTFYNYEWPTVKKGIKEGDFVVISFGHNDGGNLWEKRSTINGTSPTETMVVTNDKGVKETIYSFGQYMRMFVDEVRALGATPILCSRTPRGSFSNGKLGMDNNYRQWSMAVAKEKGVAFIDIEGVANPIYTNFGEWKVTQLYYNGTLHTSLLGAWHNAYCAALSIAANEENPLRQYLLDTTPPTMDIERQAGKPYTFTAGGDDTSARGTFRSGRWSLIYNTLEKGDSVMLVFGPNELKSITGSGELGCIQSADESREVKQMSSTSRWEVVGSYGWYIHYFINDIKEKGAIAVIVNDKTTTPDKVMDWNSTLAKKYNVELREASDITGISEALAVYPSPSHQPAYSLSGQRVGNGYKGIVVKDGRKVLQRGR
jgi:lysophospholipase L1-like esterase